jgi:SAM-dependent methyltransferase
LNIGVGRGGIEEVLLRKGVQVSSLDPDPDAVGRIADQLGLGSRAKVGYSQSIPFVDSSFDTVVMSEVLEHLTDDVLNETLSELERVLKPNGALIGTVPAAEVLSEQRVVCPSCGVQFHRWGHEQSFDCARLRSVLDERFRIESLSRQNFGDPRTLNRKGRLVLMVKKVLLRLGVTGSGDTFFFVARRR